MVIYENKQKFFHDCKWNLFNYFVLFLASVFIFLAYDMGYVWDRAKCIFL